MTFFHFDSVCSDAKTIVPRSFIALLLVVGVCTAMPVLAADVSGTPHNAVVKINTYVLNQYNALSLWGSGSGIIITESGVVLTNFHVTAFEEVFDNSLRETAMQVCLTIDPNLEPECSYAGLLMARDKGLDVALLKLVPINDTFLQDTYPYLQLDRSGGIAAGDKVKVLGYPSIGQETITISEGIVSGKLNKYKTDWLKTDAVVSFGDSGGAGVNLLGRVVGLTSQAHSDTAGTLGYLINVSSLGNWIDAHINDGTKSASFQNQLRQFSGKQLEAKAGDTFKNTKPPYSVVKPHDWDFVYNAEDGLIVTKKEDTEGGSITIATQPLPVRASTDLGLTIIKEQLLKMGYLGLVNDFKKTPTNINGLAGDKITVSVAGQTIMQYIFSLGNYVISVTYGYGRLDKDKAIVDGIINSLRPTGETPFAVQSTYTSTNPVISLVSGGQWGVLGLNSKTDKVELRNGAWPSAVVALQFVKIEAKDRDMTNEEKEKLLRDQVTTVNNASAAVGLKYTVIDSSAHFKLNDELVDGVMFAVKVSKSNTDEMLFEMIDHYYKQDGYYADISFNMFAANQQDFDLVLSGVRQTLSSLSFKTTKTATVQAAASISPQVSVSATPQAAGPAPSTAQASKEAESGITTSSGQESILEQESSSSVAESQGPTPAPTAEIVPQEVVRPEEVKSVGDDMFARTPFMWAAVGALVLIGGLFGFFIKRRFVGGK